VRWMDFMGPVVGMELAMAKNSAVRSVMMLNSCFLTV
jgi:hypothetical protein